MSKVTVNIPRVFYLNSKAPITEEFPGRCVNKILPHGGHSYNLIEVHVLFSYLYWVLLVAQMKDFWGLNYTYCDHLNRS